MKWQIVSSKHFPFLYIQIDFSYINSSEIIQIFNCTILLIIQLLNKISTTLLLIPNFFQEEI